MGPLRRAALALLALALARAEFASVELSLSARAALRWILAALLASVLGMLGLFALSATIVLALWERYSWYPLAALGLLYCASTLALLLWVLRSIGRAPPLLAQTFAELAKDGAALRCATAAPDRSDADDVP